MSTAPLYSKTDLCMKTKKRKLKREREVKFSRRVEVRTRMGQHQKRKYKRLT